MTYLIACLCVFAESSVVTAVQALESTLQVQVRASTGPVAGAEVLVNGISHKTGEQGTLVVTMPAGKVQIVVAKEGFVPASTSLELRDGQQQSIVIELQPSPTVEEEVTVVATRGSDKRLEDLPMRVEVLGREEIEEKMLMTPGDIVMMLNEMGGMRVQATSPSLGAASVRDARHARAIHAVSFGRTPAVRRTGRFARAAADPADGSRAGRSDQGSRVIAIRRRGDGRRRQPDLAPSWSRAGA